MVVFPKTEPWKTYSYSIFLYMYIQKSFVKSPLYTTTPKFSYSSCRDKGFSPYREMPELGAMGWGRVGRGDLELSEWFLEESPLGRLMSLIRFN